MGQQPSFDISKMSTADKILGGAGILFFLFTFFPWQRECFQGFCASANAWSGNGGFLGVLAGISSLLLVVWLLLPMLGVRLNMNVSPALVAAALAGLTVLLALIKFLVVVTAEVGAGFGAYIGVILALVLAYGGYMKWQEAQAAPPLPPSMPPQAPPPAPPPVG